MEEKIIKVRLDNYLVETSQVENRSKVKNLVRQGLILIDGNPATKAGQLVIPEETEIEILEEFSYVSRSAYKLKEALAKVKINLQNLNCADIGASTGGFTQVLLENSVAHVYCVDVGHSQLHPTIQSDPRVTSYEKINAKDEMPIPKDLDFMVADLSFISIEKYILNLFQYLKNDGKVLILFKPQFQVGPENIVGGVVKSKKHTEQALKELESFLHKNKLYIRKLCPLNIKGKKGNQEFFLLISR